MNFIDAYLNRTTMYRLTRTGLIILAVFSIIAAFLGWLPYTALDLTLSLVVLLFSAYVTNALCALVVKAAPTPESSLITGLILFFIFTPLQSAGDALLLMLAAAIAMLSKYVIAYKKKHIFNPAAVAAFAFSIVGSGVASWWVATPVLLPLAAVVGFLFVRKLRRFDLFWSFFIVASVVFLIRSLFLGTALGSAALLFLESFPVLFFGTIMLTEPQTTPPQRSDRVIYGGIVGLLFSLSFQFGPLSATPEFALLMGNIYSYAVSMRKRVILTFNSATQLSRYVFEYLFEPSEPFAFVAGQYAEWTIAHRSDSRGVRRYFTISSAPEDLFVRVGVRIPVESSTFKDHLRALTKGDEVSLTGVGGGFILPTDPDTKIAAIAGGIGMTPYMSMFRHLAATSQRRDVFLIYAAANPLDFAYQEELDSIKNSIGLRVLYLPTGLTELTGWEGLSGYVTDALIKKEIPDYKEREWYLSGPNTLVEDYSWVIRKAGVPRKNIKKDYFPGF